MITEGVVYRTLLADSQQAKTPYTLESRECVETTVAKLLSMQTTKDRPGMLLGMIQAGKTKTFLGVIALAIDNGFSLFIVLTKGTRALSTQTHERLKETFASSIDDEHLQIFDIMSLRKLSGFELTIPIVLVVKKNKDNLLRLEKLLFETYPTLGRRKALIIDDEADYASVGFKRSKQETIELQRIMQQIDDLRQNLPDYSFLQVTATPYSLYLQPAEMRKPEDDTFKPIRPAFTELVPIHEAYIGGDFYFEEAKKEGSVASNLYHPIAPSELDVLHHEDRRRLKTGSVLSSGAIPGLRCAIANFIVGGILRRLQQEQAGEKKARYSFIIHTEAGKRAHSWQETVIETLVEKLKQAASDGSDEFRELISAAYADLSRSVSANHGYLPPLEQVLAEAKSYLAAIQVEKVNSENDVKELLDQSGQLALRNRLNIFIGGQILDRGLTIANLIGFYYGRRTNRFQQDTVLQHSRMYGARSLADLAVSRFYTTADLYGVMRTINDFDTGLRKAFREGGHEAGVVFIRKEGMRIVPCSPNKILVSSLTTLRSGTRLLPTGFQTGYKTHIAKQIDVLDRQIAGLITGPDQSSPVRISLEVAKKLIQQVSGTLESTDDTAFDWDVEAFLASMEYVSKMAANESERGTVMMLVRKDRNIGRRRQDGRVEDAPDSGSMGDEYRAIQTSVPTLMMFRQQGASSKGWRDCPFWWPVLYMPQKMGTVVFAADIYDQEAEVDTAE